MQTYTTIPEAADELWHIHGRYYFWPCIGSRNFRLHTYCDLALVLLDRRNRRRPTMVIPALHARNLRTRNNQTACTKATQRGRRCLHHGSNRAREYRHRPHRHRCANSSNPHDLLRAARPLFLHLHPLHLQHLLHLLPSLPNHRIGIYDFNAGEGLTFLPTDHRRRHLPMLGLGPPPGPSAQQAVGAQRRDAAAAARLPRGATLRALAFWAGWTARKSVSWIVSTLAGIPFGIGYLCLFMAFLNYLIDAYEIFAASAMAASGTSRSTFGAVLPFAARPMY